MNPSLPWGFPQPPISSFSLSPRSSFSLSPRSSYFSSFTTSYFVVNNAPPQQLRQSVSPAISPVIASSLNPYQDYNWMISSHNLKGQGIDVGKQDLGFNAQRVEAKTKASAKTINATETARQPQNHDGPKPASTPSFWASILKYPSKQKSNQSMITKEGLPEDMLNVETIKHLASLYKGHSEDLQSTIIYTYGNNKEVSSYAKSLTNSFLCYRFLMRDNTKAKFEESSEDDQIGRVKNLMKDKNLSGVEKLMEGKISPEDKKISEGFAVFFKKYLDKTLENGQNSPSSVGSDNQRGIMENKGNPVYDKAPNGKTHNPEGSKLQRMEQIQVNKR